MDDHSLHSPFVYQLYNDAILPAKKAKGSVEVGEVLNRFLEDSSVITYSDPGAGSQRLNDSSREVREIAKMSTSSTKVSDLLCRLASYTGAKHIIELGTSLGINAHYLAKVGGLNVYTIEGVKELHDLAGSHLKEVSLVTQYLGNIDDILPEVLKEVPQMEIAYIDANHTYQASIDYFDMIAKYKMPSSVIVLGDIHWSDEMEKAWAQLTRHESVSLSIDLFHCGLLFFLPMREKQHYIISF